MKPRREKGGLLAEKCDGAKHHRGTGKRGTRKMAKRYVEKQDLQREKRGLSAGG